MSSDVLKGNEYLEYLVSAGAGLYGAGGGSGTGASAGVFADGDVAGVLPGWLRGAEVGKSESSGGKEEAAMSRGPLTWPFSE